MIRLHFVVEGQTEEQFVNTVLGPHLWARSVFSFVRCVETGRSRLKVYRGGGGSYGKMKHDLVCWLRQESGNVDARFTTMFDFYRLPSDFPGRAEARNVGDPYQRIALLERAFEVDVDDRRFIPYVQLHEFEALLLSDPVKFSAFDPEGRMAKGIENLCALAARHKSPEEINEGDETSPSKRIEEQIPGYSKSKVPATAIIMQQIPLDTIRKKCRHFDAWLTKLEALGQATDAGASA